MRTDGIFEIHELTVRSPKGRTHTLIPFGDVHHDSPGHSKEKWQEFLARAKSADYPLFLGMGDYTDSFSASERLILYDGRLHESTKKREEAEARGRIQRIADDLSFMRGHMIGLLGGNHFVQFSDGTTGDMLLANKLGCRYLGVCAAVRLTFITTGGEHMAIDIFAHHGRGAGITTGGRMNSVEKMAAVCTADIYLMGDNHARGVLPLGEKIGLFHSSRSGLMLRAKRSWIGRTGSFLRGYVPGESSYIVDRCLPPSTLGWIEFHLTPRRPGGDDDRYSTVEIRAWQ